MRTPRYFSQALSRLLRDFSYFIVPAAIILLSIGLLLTQENPHRPKDGLSLEFAALADTDSALTPAQALARLEGAAPIAKLSTRRAEHPFWLHIDTDGIAPSATPRVVEFPSRHTTEISCWNAATLQLLGRADRWGASGTIRTEKSGYALPLPETGAGAALLCRASHSGPATVSAMAWSDADLAGSARAFKHEIGLLEGGILTLAVFVLMTALINREARYAVFAIWLIGNLRLGALSMGWDTEWLGHPIPPDWMPMVRKLTMASYYLVTYVLFVQLLRAEMPRTGYRWVLGVVRWAGVLLLVLALVLPYASFLPFMWLLVGVGASGVLFYLLRALVVTRSRTALWCSVALALVLFATVGEVIGAAFSLTWLTHGLNSVTAALAASLMTALAFAEQMREERLERRQAQVELHSTYQVAPVGLFTLSDDGAFVRANPSMRNKLGIQERAVHTRRWHDFFETTSFDTLRRLAAQPHGGEAETHGGRGTSIEGRGFLIRVIRAGARIEGSLQDITERLQATEKLRFLAHHDPLTSALNRLGINERLDACLKASDDHAPLAIAYLDLNRFKLVNDLYGHQTGDEVLCQVYGRIASLLARDHHIGRLGGDEFLVLMPDTPSDAAEQIGRDIAEALNGSPFRIDARAFQVRAAVGIVETRPHMLPSDAISLADRACRDAKRKANHLVVYRKGAPEFERQAEELRLIEELGNTFTPTGLFLEMQPIMSLRTPQKSLNFEVLLRMRDSSGKLISVDKILASAEAAGHMAELDKWVLTTTLGWLDTHLPRLIRTQFVCVNLSGSSLNDEAFINAMFAILDDFKDSARFLCIELTESVALHDIDNTRRVLEGLRSRHVRIALDDFGAGYTSFSYLKAFSADALKIDGSFIRSMRHHPADIAIVEAIVELARNLGMRSIAEWVEDYETVQALADIGVDYVQGYVIARPQSPEVLLQAASAASFITDERLAEFVRDVTSKEAAFALDFDGPPNYYH